MPPVGVIHGCRARFNVHFHYLFRHTAVAIVWFAAHADLFAWRQQARLSEVSLKVLCLMAR